MITSIKKQPCQSANKPSEKKLALINKAREVIRGSRTLNTKELKELYSELEHYNQFAYATEVLLIKIDNEAGKGCEEGLKDHQKLALYIYKDHSLPSSFKFKKALKELQKFDNLNATSNCESLGLTGAIYKRKWQFDHQFRNLILSRYYYGKGYKKWKEYLSGSQKAKEDTRNDDGYTSINYAYINELMAVDKLEEHGEITGLSESIDSRLKEAEEVRTYILDNFIKLNDKGEPVLKSDDFPAWVLATVAEAFFGLRKYKEAEKFINQYISLLTNKPWEKKTFNQQLLSLAYLQVSQKNFSDSHINNGTNLSRIAAEINLDGINQCLEKFAAKKNLETAKDEAIKKEIKKSGKLGLALSGGGFRASLFHIGVLAALAEKNELKDVEVLSCVSGGSIIGAYYYIKLKRLLESTEDGKIKRSDYIDLVKEIEVEFLKAIQNNLRVRIFSNPFKSIKMLFSKNYSRTHRLGELYESFLYKKAWGTNERIFMDCLFIKPEGDQNFDITGDNWSRINKIPQLVLNATSLNTGHNWQFTASWMGEPPGNIQPDVDAKPRLRRMYYEEAPKPYRKFRLGYAVGASSCVPVMFYPMPMYDLYPGINLQLVDGGLHDNQGIAALIEQECNNMIISDASGQMPIKNVATGNELSLFYRADTVLQERLRELQFMDLKERHYTAALNRLNFVHLKNDLQERPVSWKFCVDPARETIYKDLLPEYKELTKYGLLRSVQLRLAEIRTDLDSFNDLEAYALMYSGYQQIHHELKDQNTKEEKDPSQADWKFLAIKDYVTIPEKEKEISKVLKTGSKVFLKLPSLSKAVKIGCILLLLFIVFLIGKLIVSYWQKPLSVPIKTIVVIIGIFVIGFFSKPIATLLNIRSAIKKWLVLIGLIFVGFFVSVFYLLLLNPLYNRIGRIKHKKINP